MLALMREYLKSTLVRIGLIGLVLGSGPLLAIIAAAKTGLLSDPNPNPVGPGILAGLTFWPAVICVLVGVVRVGNSRRNAALKANHLKRSPRNP